MLSALLNKTFPSFLIYKRTTTPKPAHGSGQWYTYLVGSVCWRITDTHTLLGLCADESLIHIPCWVCVLTNHWYTYLVGSVCWRITDTHTLLGLWADESPIHIPCWVWVLTNHRYNTLLGLGADESLIHVPCWVCVLTNHWHTYLVGSGCWRITDTRTLLGLCADESPIHIPCWVWVLMNHRYNTLLGLWADESLIHIPCCFCVLTNHRYTYLVATACWQRSWWACRWSGCTVTVRSAGTAVRDSCRETSSWAPGRQRGSTAWSCPGPCPEQHTALGWGSSRPPSTCPAIGKQTVNLVGEKG